jgi:hypothetical protein
MHSLRKLDLKLTIVTPKRTDLLEVLIIAAEVMKFPACYETRRFITVFTTAGHWTLF